MVVIFWNKGAPVGVGVWGSQTPLGMGKVVVLRGGVDGGIEFTTVFV